MNNYFNNNNVFSNEDYCLLTSDDAKHITDQISQFVDSSINKYFSKTQINKKIIMTNIEKYNNAFKETLNISDEQLEGLQYQGVELWDSVGHMTLVAALEDAFDIMMETDDIVDLSSYEKGKEILSKNYDIEF